MTPRELADRYGFVLNTGNDGFDDFEDVCLKLASGRQVFLLQYARNPHPGTMVFIDEEDDARAALAELSFAMRLGRAAFAWVDPSI